MMKITMLAMAAALAMTAGNAAAQTPRHARTETQAELAREARIPMAKARETALAGARGAHVKSEELERDHGRLVYAFDLAMPGKSGMEEVQVDAMTGHVISRKHESEKAEKKEMKQEKKEMKHERKEMKGRAPAARHMPAPVKKG